MSERYIPNAYDQIIAYFGTNHAGGFRLHCAVCIGAHPLNDPHKVYGDAFVSTGPIDRAEMEDRCDACGVTLAALSADAQAQHDEQQARWSRNPITHVIEMGMVGAVRCRIY